MYFPVSIIDGEPAWDSLPAAKITEYPLEKGTYKPYAMAKICMSQRHLYIRMFSFEVSPEKESKLCASISAEKGKYLFFSTTREGNFELYFCDENTGEEKNITDKANIRISTGEDEQGIYWCVDYVMYIPELMICFPSFHIENGFMMKGNFYKISSGKRSHTGFWVAPDEYKGEKINGLGFSDLRLCDF